MVATKIGSPRESVACSKCELVQYRLWHNKCRRCGSPLPVLRGSVESTTVIVVAGKAREILPMRDVMQRAVVEAVRISGATTKAARSLGIPHSRLKQLLRDSGDHTDYRTRRKARREGQA